MTIPFCLAPNRHPILCIVPSHGATESPVCAPAEARATIPPKPSGAGLAGKGAEEGAPDSIRNPTQWFRLEKEEQRRERANWALTTSKRRLRQISDEICMEHQLSVLAPEQQRKESKPSTREYRSAAKGESWKFRLMNMIDECMRYASSREEFIRLMRSEGYDVRWSDSRKNITYTTPEGMKCRDARLHEKKYLKEVMEFEFRIRAEILYGRTAPEEQADAAASGAVPGPDAAAHRDAMRYAAGDGGAAQSDPVPGGRYTVFTGESANAAPSVEPEEGTHGDTPDAQAAGNTDATGWEEEREAFLASALSPPQNPYPSYVVLASPGWSGAAGSVVQLGKALERGADPVPVRDSTTMPLHVDRKQRAKEREKKIALGHRADDHEERQSYSQQII